MPRACGDKYRDGRTQQVMGFLLGKGFLIGEGIALRDDEILDVEDVRWVGRNIEPRVLEVFPAALIHFPEAFMHTARIPSALKKVIAAIKAGDQRGPDFEGLRYRDMKRWADKATPDRRTKPLSEA